MKCTYIKDNGEQCKANAMQEEAFCYLHNPAIPEEQKREAQTRGGANRALTVSEALPVIHIKKPRDTIKLLADTIDRVRAGEMDVRIANSIGVLSGHLIKAFEITQLNERVEIIERVVMEKRTKY